MPDKALRGRGLLGVGKAKHPRMGREAPKRKSKQEEREDSYAALGRAVTGIEGKPHSTREGRIAAGERALRRNAEYWTRDEKKRKKEKTILITREINVERVHKHRLDLVHQ